MLEEDFLRASLPLFEAGVVEVLEWSFDVGWSLPQLPRWADELLKHYSQADALLGHGVTFSALSGEWSLRQQAWLTRFTQELRERNYVHVSEHFGFASAGDFHRSTPLPVPLTENSLRLGQQRLQALRDAGAPAVGIENLAFAFGRQDVADQGKFLAGLLDPVDGFLVLDLHNLYCQRCNFGLSWEELLALYPCERVQELHVSGGSWSQHAGVDVRRDTHDGPVPTEVFEVIPLVLQRCSRTKFVIFERLGGTIPDVAAESSIREDYRRLTEIVEGCYHAR